MTPTAWIVLGFSVWVILDFVFVVWILKTGMVSVPRKASKGKKDSR